MMMRIIKVVPPGWSFETLCGKIDAEWHLFVISFSQKSCVTLRSNARAFAVLSRNGRCREVIRPNCQGKQV
jgi:hypothetical protein